MYFHAHPTWVCRGIKLFQIHITIMIETTISIDSLEKISTLTHLGAVGYW